MIKGINCWAFPPESDGSQIKYLEAMSVAKNLGYDCIELAVGLEGELSLDTGRVEANRLRTEAEDIGLKLITLASTIAMKISPTAPDPEVREQAVKNYIKILEISSWLGVETLLYLPGLVSLPVPSQNPPQRYDLVDQRAKESLKKILPAAEKLNIKIAVENVWNKYLLSPVEMRDFIDFFDSPLVGSYFDTGNVMLYGHPEHWIEILGKRIFAVHLKDFRVNVGNMEGFVDLLAGDVDFDRVMKAFKKIGYDNAYTVEIERVEQGGIEKAFTALKILEQK
ncbi:MAG: sugar phosphate isomerase/epimerase family protein [Planctomycetota bacterium]|jgi:hexulose-6-phosphate isomerase